MTYCTLGSQPKPDSPAYFWVNQALFLAFAFAKFSRLANVLWFTLPTTLTEVAAMCATEPVVPAPPPLSTWALALISPISQAAADVKAYLQSAFQAWVWDQYCECTPTTVTPGLVCRIWYVDTLTPSFQRLHRADLTLIDHIDGTPPSSGTFTVETADSLEMAFMVYPDGTLGSQLLELDTGIGGGVTVTQSLNPSYAYYGIQARSIGGVTLGPVIIKFCYSGVGASDPTYVPPDPVIPPEIPDAPTVHACTSFDEVCAAINELRLEMEGLFRALPAPAKAVANLGWRYGTPLTGLTGHGSFDALGILGVLVECSVPVSWGRTREVPGRSIPSMGGIQFGIDAVPQDKRQVHYDLEMILDPPELADSVFWNFALGVTGTITPLLPVEAFA